MTVILKMRNIKPFVKDLNIHIEILNNFTSWIKEKITKLKR